MADSSRVRQMGFNLLFCVAIVLLIGMKPEPHRSSIELESEPAAFAPLVIADWEIPLTEKHHGVSWEGRHTVSAEHMRPLEELGANWMVQTPFGWQKNHHSPDLRMSTSGNMLWGESDEGLVTTQQLARAAHIQVLLKPHIWITRPEEGKWRSHIAMTSEKDWQTWFANYRTFMLHYAQLAQEQQIAALCVGTELSATVEVREADWRALIAAIREVYDGKLVYAANWYDEYEKVPFWDALDWIGIQAYFPLSDQLEPSLKELVEGWQPHLSKMADIAKKFDKPIIFTEVGYRATVDAARDPWTWPKRRKRATEEGLATQARCYEAFFQTVWPQPWFGGAYIWKWRPVSGKVIGEREEYARQTFTPQFKPAMDVLYRYYGPNAKR